MEDDTRRFLVLIVNTIAMVFIWMMLNVLVGIYFELAFFDTWPRWQNYLYYAAFVVSLFFLVKYLAKKWRA